MNAIVNTPNASHAAAEDALNNAIYQINDQIETADPKSAKNLSDQVNSLTEQLKRFTNDDILEALNSPAVVNAAAQLDQLSKDMNTTAQKMTDATKTINNIDQLMTLSTGFLNIFKTAQG